MLLKFIDPRFIQIINNSTLMVYGYFYLNFNRGMKYLIHTFVLAVILEIILGLIFTKDRSERKVFDRSISIINTMASLFVIINVDNPLFYLYATLLAVASKYLFKIKNRHVFNPANFGIVLSLVFITDSYVKIIYNQFSSPQTFLFWFVIFNGLVITIWAKRILLALSYLLFSILFIYLLSPYFGFTHLFLIGPSLSLSGLLFTFFMITDPKTTPNQYRDQIIFGIVCAFIGSMLRLNQMVHDSFVALFLTTACYSVYRTFKDEKMI